MNVLYLSLGDFEDLTAGSVHVDLMRQFSEDHNVYIACKSERRNNKGTKVEHVDGLNILKIKTGNIKKAGLLEKGLSTIMLEYQFINAIKTFFSDVHFDLILYTTPPITFAGIVKYFKQRDGAYAYLLLKDIFPQNAVDIGLLKKQGVEGIVYSFFRYKEKQLYKVSDYIGCMSEANVKYILAHNELNGNSLEICPNCIIPNNKSMDEKEKKQMRNKYSLPTDKKIFVYGGNLGKPQGIDFLIQCIDAQRQDDRGFFLLIGDGTEYRKLESYIENIKPKNVRLMKSLSRNEYDQLVGCCDVGMIFLDYRFTIPNFPSRILSYMQAQIPIYAVTDPNTDLGSIIEDNGFGWWSPSNDVDLFMDKIRAISSQDKCKEMGKNGYNYLCKHYNVLQAYNIIMAHFN